MGFDFTLGRVAFSDDGGFGDEVFTKNLEGFGRGFLLFLWVLLKGGCGETVCTRW
jgi:hypothetical protein